MNALERYRNEHGMTFEALGAAAGFDKGNAHKHCRADPIPPEAVLRYHAAYAIPLEDLRPDLYPLPGQGLPCDPASSSREPGQGDGDAA
ncbi:MAG: hypothetical protein FD177_244 [Desulfovibrionaceae bacterium]|nr:MAG: hypothetical protein FD177_244 [Desulfovibrionaceae bacterium]